MNNYLEIARTRWPGHCIGGNGRFAIDTPAWKNAKILLFETRAEAQRTILDPKQCVIIDLDGPSVLDMHDRYDYEDRKKERREQRG